MRQTKMQKGVTLIELMIAVVIMGMIGLGLVSLQYILTQNQIAITKNYKSVDNANFTMSNIIKEIRTARQSDNGAYFLNLAGDYEIIFYSDIDLDGKTEWVRYFLDETDLVKEIIRPSGYPAVYDTLTKNSSVVAEGVRNNTTPIFSYYSQTWPIDTTNNPLASDDRLSETKTIKIYLRVNEENNPERDYVVESFSQVRSAKENL